MLKEIVSRVLVAVGLAAFLRALLWRRRTAILLYHDPDPETLDRHLAFLKRLCRIVSLDELLAAVEGRRAPPGRSVVITIDDGHAGNARLVDVFRKHGVRPTLYLCSQIVGQGRMFWWQHPEAVRRDPETLKRLPNAERLRLLAEGGFAQDGQVSPRVSLSTEEMQRLHSVADLQSHSRFHPILTKLPDAECREEIDSSKREIEAISGAPCDHFSFPNGDYGEREIAILKAAGYKTGRTCDIGWNDARTDPFRLRCLPIADDASLAWLSLQLTGLPTYLRYAKAGSFAGKSPRS